MRQQTGLSSILLIFLMASGCGVMVRSANNGWQSFTNSGLFHQGRHGRLTEKEKVWAAVAWKYFENNTKETGLANGSDQVPSASMWQTADYLAALISAHELGLVTDHDFDVRLSRLLKFLNTISLVDGCAPNKLYHTEKGVAVNYKIEDGLLGWSAMDIGRLLIWLKIARERYPLFSEYVDKIILRWNFCDLIDNCGQLYGSVKKPDGQLQIFQEGRLGYEEYAALGYQLWGFNSRRASLLKPYQEVKIFDLTLPFDARDPRQFSAMDNIVTAPYVLWGMEMGWKTVCPVNQPEISTASIARNIYCAQERRYRRDKILTARTDHQLLQEPYYLYDAIYAYGFPWNTVADDGKYHPWLSLVSTRAVFGMWALWKTKYTTKLMSAVEHLYDKDRGWYEGRYERTAGYDGTITCSTNSMVLQALLYKTKGRLYNFDTYDGYYQANVADAFKRPPDRCLPPDLEDCNNTN